VKHDRGSFFATSDPAGTRGHVRQPTSWRWKPCAAKGRSLFSRLRQGRTRIYVPRGSAVVSASGACGACARPVLAHSTLPRPTATGDQDKSRIKIGTLANLPQGD